jgi:hypothetical protein
MANTALSSACRPRHVARHATRPSAEYWRTPQTGLLPVRRQSAGISSRGRDSMAARCAWRQHLRGPWRATSDSCGPYRKRDDGRLAFGLRRADWRAPPSVPACAGDTGKSLPIPRDAWKRAGFCRSRCGFARWALVRWIARTLGLAVSVRHWACLRLPMLDAACQPNGQSDPSSSSKNLPRARPLAGAFFLLTAFSK